MVGIFNHYCHRLQGSIAALVDVSPMLIKSRFSSRPPGLARWLQPEARPKDLEAC